MNKENLQLRRLGEYDKVLVAQTPTTLTVHWLRETYLDDTLVCRMARTADGGYLHTLATADGITVCELLSRWQPLPSSSDVSEVLDRGL